MQEEGDSVDEQVKNYMAVVIDYSGQRQVNCALYVQDKRLLQVCEFPDNEHFSNLESLLIQVNPKEAGVSFRLFLQSPDISTEREKLSEKLEDLDVVDLKSKATGAIERQLGYLLKQPIKNYVREMANPKNMKVLERLLEELKLQSDATNKLSLELELLNLTTCMRLDNAAIQSLQIFPKKMQKRVLVSNETVFDMLNRCKTASGTRCLKRWLKQPLQSREAIELRLNMLTYFLNNGQLRKFIQNEVLNQVCDLDRLYFTFFKVHSEKQVRCEMSDLLKLYKLIRGLNTLSERLTSRQSDEFCAEKLLPRIREAQKELEMPATMIENNIVMEGTESEYYVKPNTQANLRKLMKTKDQLAKEVRQELERARDELGIEIELTSSTGQLHLFQGDKREVSDSTMKDKSYKIISVRGTKATFSSNRLASICSEIASVNEEYKKEEKEVLRRMFKVIASYYEILQNLSGFLSELDIYTTFAALIAVDPRKWTRPTISHRLYGKDMMHPCLKQCVPNDIKMEDNKTIIITGPNMGGKSTFIRTVGICTYLAHIGFYAPAQSFETPIIDAIITRVGASDMQLKGISTFMSQMLETACMLKTATPHSLVLIDELGRGTSTHQGFGIAWAICEFLHREIKPYVLFATHFHEMTKMPEEIDGVVNMHAQCRLEGGKLLMDYKIEPGQISKSYGIDLAESIGFPKDVVHKARQFAEGLEKFEDEIVSSSQKGMDIERNQLGSEYSISYEAKLKVVSLVNDAKEKHGEDMPEEVLKELQEAIRKLVGA